MPWSVCALAVAWPLHIFSKHFSRKQTQNCHDQLCFFVGWIVSMEKGEDGAHKYTLVGRSLWPRRIQGNGKMYLLKVILAQLSATTGLCNVLQLNPGWSLVACEAHQRQTAESDTCECNHEDSGTSDVFPSSCVLPGGASQERCRWRFFHQKSSKSVYMCSSLSLFRSVESQLPQLYAAMPEKIAGPRANSDSDFEKNRLRFRAFCFWKIPQQQGKGSLMARTMRCKTSYFAYSS